MSSGFISEAEIAEQRKVRQEEWNNIRTADQPSEPPEEPYCSKSLYERLQERRNERDIEYEEAHKFKNMIKVLDDDEVEFLDLVDRTKFEEERKKNLEEEKEMQDFKAAVSSLQEKTLNNKLMQELQGPHLAVKTSSQSGQNLRLKILSGVVVKKPAKTNTDTQLSEDQPTGNKRKHSDVTNETDRTDLMPGDKINLPMTENHLIPKCVETQIDDGSNKNMQCIGILPGLGFYANSSDSDDCSSESEDETTCKKVKYDILGRQIVSQKDKDKC